MRHPTRPHLTAALAVAAAALAAAVPATSATAAPAPASASASACSKPTEQPAGTTAKYTVASGGLEREYTLHLPANYTRSSGWPLIVAYHGRGSTGTEVEGFSGLSSLPAIVAYPDGAIGTGDGYRQAWQGAPYEPVGVDDVQFTRDLLDQIQRDFCADSNRTYATGKSNGAGFTALLACQLPDRFAAVAPVAAALYPGERVGCEGSQPVPMLEIHGTGDATIPYAGDADRDLPAIADWVAGWAAHNGCTGTPNVRRTGTDVTTTTWSDCANDAEVQHVAVTGGGHVWPGAEVYSGGGYVTQTIEAQDVIWQFLRHHTLTEGAQR